MASRIQMLLSNEFFTQPYSNRNLSQTFPELASTVFQFILFSLMNQLIKIKSSYLFLKYPDYPFVAKTPLFHTHVPADKLSDCIYPFLQSEVFSSSCIVGSIKIYLRTISDSNYSNFQPQPYNPQRRMSHAQIGPKRRI